MALAKKRKTTEQSSQQRLIQTTLTREVLPATCPGRIIVAEKLHGKAESYDAACFFRHAAHAEARRCAMERFEVVPRVNGTSRAMFHIVGDNEDAVTVAGALAVATCIAKGWGGTTFTVLRRAGHSRGVRIIVDAKCPSLSAATRALRESAKDQLSFRVVDVPSEAAGVFCSAQVDSPYYISAPFCGAPPFVPTGGALTNTDPRMFFLTCPVF